MPAKIQMLERGGRYGFYDLKENPLPLEEVKKLVGDDFPPLDATLNFMTLVKYATTYAIWELKLPWIWNGTEPGLTVPDDLADKTAPIAHRWVVKENKKVPGDLTKEDLQEFINIVKRYA